MKIYMFDVKNMLDSPHMSGEDAMKSELIWLHRDILRSCTTKRHVMQAYYNFMKQILGRFVEVVVYEYNPQTSYDNKKEGMPDDIVAPLAMTLYNQENDKLIHSLTILHEYHTENDELVPVSAAMEDLFMDYNEKCRPEVNILDTIAILFTELGRYLHVFKTSEEFVSFIQMLHEVVPDIFYDSYNPESRFSISVQQMLITWVAKLEFLH